MKTYRELMVELARRLDQGLPAAVVIVVAGQGIGQTYVGCKWLFGRDMHGKDPIPLPVLLGSISGEAGVMPDWLVGAATDAANISFILGEVSVRRYESPGGWVDLFADLAVPVPSLLVCGGGHISQPLVAMGAMAGFQVTVIDDRPQFANRERFPTAYRVICQSFGPALAGLPVNSSTYIVVVTRGHRYDEVCLRAVIGSPAAYIGMIGSRRRVAGVLAGLVAEGVAPALVERVHAPIGLDIGAETPGEIAVSILAEIIHVRHRGRGAVMSLKKEGGYGSRGN